MQKKKENTENKENIGKYGKPMYDKMYIGFPILISSKTLRGKCRKYFGMENEMRKFIKKIIITVFIMVIVGTLFYQNAFSGEKERNQIDYKALDCLEAEFSQQVHSILNVYHLANCGVTMTKTTDQNQVEYQVMLHHIHFEKMKQTEKKNLLHELEQLSHPEMGINVSFEFI